MKLIGFLVSICVNYLLTNSFPDAPFTVYASILISFHIFLGCLFLLADHETKFSLPISQIVFTHFAFVAVVVLLLMARHSIPFFAIARYFIPTFALLEFDLLIAESAKQSKQTHFPVNSAIASQVSGEDYEAWLVYLASPHNRKRITGMSLRREYERFMLRRLDKRRSTGAALLSLVGFTKRRANVPEPRESALELWSTIAQSSANVPAPRPTRSLRSIFGGTGLVSEPTSPIPVYDPEETPAATPKSELAPQRPAAQSPVLSPTPQLGEKPAARRRTLWDPSDAIPPAAASVSVSKPEAVPTDPVRTKPDVPNPADQPADPAPIPQSEETLGKVRRTLLETARPAAPAQPLVPAPRAEEPIVKTSQEMPERDSAVAPSAVHVPTPLPPAGSVELRQPRPEAANPAPQPSSFTFASLSTLMPLKPMAPFAPATGPKAQSPAPAAASQPEERSPEPAKPSPEADRQAAKLPAANSTSALGEKPLEPRRAILQTGSLITRSSDYAPIQPPEVKSPRPLKSEPDATRVTAHAPVIIPTPPPVEKTPEPMRAVPTAARPIATSPERNSPAPPQQKSSEPLKPRSEIRNLPAPPPIVNPAPSPAERPSRRLGAFLRASRPFAKPQTVAPHPQPASSAVKPPPVFVKPERPVDQSPARAPMPPKPPIDTLRTKWDVEESVPQPEIRRPGPQPIDAPPARPLIESLRPRQDVEKPVSQPEFRRPEPRPIEPPPARPLIESLRPRQDVEKPLPQPEFRRPEPQPIEPQPARPRVESLRPIQDVEKPVPQPEIRRPEPLPIEPPPARPLVESLRPIQDVEKPVPQPEIRKPEPLPIEPPPAKPVLEPLRANQEIDKPVSPPEIRRHEPLPLETKLAKSEIAKPQTDKPLDQSMTNAPAKAPNPKPGKKRLEPQKEKTDAEIASETLEMFLAVREIHDPAEPNESASAGPAI